MELRPLGTSGLQVSAIGLGCWAMGGALWGEQEDQDSIATIQRARELGVNFLDTAPVYGFGRSEEVVGRALQGRRDQVVLATKCGLQWDAEGRITNNSSRRRILQEIEDSLRRLRVDCIDLLQVHWPDQNTPLQETMGALVEIHQAGKIKAIGVSNFSAGQMAECLRHGPLHALQPPYNLFQRQIEQEILPFCREHEIGVVVYGPMYQGLLTGKYFFGEATPSDDLRRNHRELRPGRFEVNRKALEELRSIAERYDRTLAQLAINWVLSQPGITVAICGARRPDQIEADVAGAGWAISREDLAAIERVLENRAQELAALETQA